MTRAMVRGEARPGDEEFLQRLSRGGELLTAGRASEAREHLEVAAQLQPKNEKALNLLGLCCFKLGQLDRAAEVYELLVRENPVDATLRVNLGLVYLKAGALQRAIREFETATDLAPEHLKAHNYLGLALAQVGEYGRAREHFLTAGSDHMAEKMARAISGEAYSRSAAPAPPVLRPVAAPPPAPVPVTPPRLEDSWGAQVGPPGVAPSGGGEEEPPVLVLQAEDAVLPAPPAVDPELDFTGVAAEDESLPPSPNIPPGPGEEQAADALLPGTGGAQEEWVAMPQSSSAGADASAVADGEAADVYGGAGAGEAPPWGAQGWAAPPEAPLELGAAHGSQLQRLPSLGGLAEALQLLPEPPSGVFEVRDGAVSIWVRGELFTRLEGLLSVEGQVEFTPERRRQRGRPVDVPFGSGEAQLMRARGEGVLLLNGAGATFLPVELGEESAYFREDALFAFEESVMFENGRMAVEAAPDLELVHLRGAGKVLLQLSGTLRSVGVIGGRPVVVPLAHLVGWQGELSPRVVSLGGKKAAGVELTGQGFVLLALAGR